jgi:DNA-binding MarR family transcriptional regulator
MVNDLPMDREQRRAQIERQVKTLFQVEDTRGLELFLSLFRLAQQATAFEAIEVDGQEISTPRWRLLLHLYISEKLHNSPGISPTELSRFQQVSKNTVSILLRGLEEQGLIQRELNPQDLRNFRILLTDAGRRLVLEITPRRIAMMNRMLAGLSTQEVADLTHLLKKFARSLESQTCPPQDPSIS